MYKFFSFLIFIWYNTAIYIYKFEMLLFLIASTEHLLVLAVFLFPPVLFTVILAVILASVGKSLGIRERYVGILIRIFEV